MQQTYFDERGQALPVKFDGRSVFWCASHRARRVVEPTHRPGEQVILPCAICEREREAVTGPGRPFPLRVYNTRFWAQEDRDYWPESAPLSPEDRIPLPPIKAHVRRSDGTDAVAGELCGPHGDVKGSRGDIIQSGEVLVNPAVAERAAVYGWRRVGRVTDALVAVRRTEEERQGLHIA